MPDTLSSVDTAWYRLDSPTDPADIIGVLICDGPVDYERLVATIEARVLCFERFRQRVDDSAIGRPHWRAAQDFDVRDHVRLVELDAPADRAALERKTSEVMSQPLDKSRPLWRLLVANNYVDERGEPGAAIIVQLHHCMGDGFALTHVLLSIADHSPDAPWPSERGRALVRAGEDTQEHHWLREALVEPLEDLLRHPTHAAKLARQAEQVTEAMGHLVRMPFDPPTRLKREPLGTRRVSWSRGIALARVKELAHALGGTVNDVLMAALAGALRRYLAEHGDDVTARDIRALVPVNLRPATRIEEMDDKLGNHFGLVFLRLPITERSARARFVRVKAYMDQLKQSPEAMIIFEVFNLAGHTPETVEHVVADVLAEVLGGRHQRTRPPQSAIPGRQPAHRPDVLGPPPRPAGQQREHHQLQRRGARRGTRRRKRAARPRDPGSAVRGGVRHAGAGSALTPQPPTGSHTHHASVQH